MSADSDIRARMQLYFDGLYHSDIEKLGHVFHPAARYVCAPSGDLLNLGIPEYFQIVARREPPAARNEKRRDEIVSIRRAGPNVAFVEARCAIGDRYFTDYLSFVKDADGWRIIAKVFHFDLLSDAS